MSSNIADLKNTLKEIHQQLEGVQANLQIDPDNEEYLEFKREIEDGISFIESAIAEAEPSKKPSPPPAKEKWSRETHPAFQAGYRKQGAPRSPVEDVQAPQTYEVNDLVTARWVSGDRSFYPAQITSITGSSSARVYLVKFKSYDTTEKITKPEDIKPMSSDSKKRKADGGPVTSAAPTVVGNSSVISAAANINPALASQARKEPSKVSDGPPRPAKAPRTFKPNKELEQNKSTWKSFTNTVVNGKVGKAVKKESMFRTGQSVNARVGFTGSGQAMRKDPTRSRHIYQQTLDEEGY